MAISRLIVEKFRNLNAVDLEFDHGFNFLVGNNGSGKTSLLEAIFYLGHGRSFKSAVANRIISYDEPHFFLAKFKKASINGLLAYKNFVKVIPSRK